MRVKKNLSVIIPYFQKDAGVLARALNSIGMQRIPSDWAIDVVVVDDGSPHPAHDELNSIDFGENFSLRVFKQENKGASAARNYGLDLVEGHSDIIALLDSDDYWPVDHLSRSIQAIDSGFDFYFTDNRRDGYHDSHVRTLTTDMANYIADSKNENDICNLPADFFVGLIISEFPAQLSSIVFKSELARDARFNTKLKSAGEDVLWLVTIVSAAKRIAFDLKSCVNCGSGLNMYYSNLSWDSPKRLNILCDQIIAHHLIESSVKLSDDSRKRNNLRLKQIRRNMGFHVARSLLKFPNRVPDPLIRLAKNDATALVLLPFDVVVGAILLFRRRKDGVT